jgi:hypothetical protein
MNIVKITIPPLLENGETAETVYMSLRKIVKSNIFKNPVDISKSKDNKTRSLRVKISFFKEQEKDFFLTLLELLDYNMLETDAEEKIKNAV